MHAFSYRDGTCVPTAMTTSRGETCMPSAIHRGGTACLVGRGGHVCLQP